MIFYALIASNILLAIALVLSVEASPGRPLLFKIFHRKYADEVLLVLSFIVIIANLFA